jgi:alpha-D-ribose 1-methylphosphonate 5-triphosphate diphosphatase PhnM
MAVESAAFMIDAGTVIQGLSTALVAVCIYIVKTHRSETRESLHQLRDTLQPLAVKVAQIEARQDERAHIRQEITDAIEKVSKNA